MVILNGDGEVVPPNPGFINQQGFFGELSS